MNNWHNKIFSLRNSLAIFLVHFLSCSPSNQNNETTIEGESFVFEFLPTPAGENSSLPDLFVDATGRLFMSWVEQDGEVSSLLYSTYINDQWTEPIKISEGSDWFVNWADFPAIASTGNGQILAHFLAKSAPDTFAYNVNLVISSDYGKTWGEPFVPHKDNTQTEHGFVSMLPMPDGNFFITWLDGRNTGSEEGVMTIRSGIVDKSGNILESTELDESVCDCCQTGAALTDNGPIVVYRDLSEEEIRDMSIVRLVNGEWTSPQTIHADGWQIAGCPVNGPKVDAIGNSMAVAWYTGANQEPKVNIAFSKDGGESFSKPIRVDDGATIGRIDLVMVSQDEAWVTWLESGENGTEIRVRSIESNGNPGPSVKVASTRKSRASGFPQLVKVNDKLMVAFTDLMDKPQVKLGLIKI